MSAIYFHTREGEAALRGSERAYAGVLVNNLALAVLGDLKYDVSWLRNLLPERCYLNRESDDQRFAERFATWFAAGDDAAFHLSDGRIVRAWDLALNTAMRIGDAPLRFLTRLHAQCEVHGWVAAGHRLWLANIIESGRAVNIMREGQGWEDVIIRLRYDLKSEVVMSYSVCEQFPNPYLDGAVSEEKAEAFWEMDSEKRWVKAMTVARRRCPQISPATLTGDYFFGEHNVSAFELRSLARVNGKA